MPEMEKQERPKFVLFGSSIVQYSFGDGGWGSTLADIYSRKADIVLRGYAGWNSRHALHVINQVFPKDAAVQPSLVIVYFGGNDSMSPHPSVPVPHVPLPEYKENMRKIANHLKGLSENMRLIFLSAPPVSAELISKNFPSWMTVSRTNENCRVYSEACMQLCQEMDIKAIDLWTAIQNRDDWSTSCFTDGIHLSAEGSKIIAKEILKVLKEAEWKPSLYWESLPTEFADIATYGPNDPTIGNKDEGPSVKLRMQKENRLVKGGRMSKL